MRAQLGTFPVCGRLQVAVWACAGDITEKERPVDSKTKLALEMKLRHLLIDGNIGGLRSVETCILIVSTRPGFVKRDPAWQGFPATKGRARGQDHAGVVAREQNQTTCAN